MKDISLEEAVELIKQEIRKAGSDPRDYTPNQIESTALALIEAYKESDNSI